MIGAGQLSKYLAQIAQGLDYQVTVCDPRVEYADIWDVEGAELRRGMPDDFVNEMNLDGHTAVVTLTHDPKLDDLALMEALKSPAFFVGAIGSKKNNDARRERLAEFDLAPHEIARLRGPVGLKIGSKTPPEIAIAILAEMTAVRNGVQIPTLVEPPKVTSEGCAVVGEQPPAKPRRSTVS
jgi:xanthine dehydrogenase accessory factor